MELEMFSKLYDRIQIDPSVLVLGQQYLSIGGGKDPVWQKICEEVYPELDLPRKKTDYPSLWKQVVKNQADAESLMARISEVGRQVWRNPAVEAILKLRWSLVYTSSIDDSQIWTTATQFNIVPYEEKSAKPQYMNKEKRYRVDLCGNCAYPPVLDSDFSRKSFKRRVSDKIAWISNEYLEYYGVLIIDGFDPEFDWLSDENFFEMLTEMPQQSVFWFGAPEKLAENAAMLVQQGILTVDDEGFYEHFVRHMPDLLESETSDVLQDSDPDLYAPLTLRLGDKQTYTVYISRADISGITGNRLCVLDDDVLSGNIVPENSRSHRFAEFLSQNDIPNWNLFNTKNNELPFYIPRDLDSTLERRVYEALKETGVARKPIVLTGPSNSGKSMMLANLALNIAKRRKYPVIFIRGDLLSGAEKRLDDFISNWFGNAERFDGHRIEKVVLIWDGSGLKRTEHDYDALQKKLFNRNVQVVGSTYTATTKSCIVLDQNLSAKEHKSLQNILSTLGGNYCERFEEIIKNRKRIKTLENSSLLYLLQALFKYEFDAEYKSLSQILAKQFNQERMYAEQETGASLNRYVETFLETQKRIVQDGVASSFQEKLKLILARVAIQEQGDASLNSMSESDDQTEKLNKLKHLSKCIEEMNGILAVASEFGVQLPLRLLLKFLQDRHGNSYVSYNEETAKIIQILRADTLISFVYKTHPKFGEEYYVSFRNPMEAENYICLMCDIPLEDHSYKRKECEIEILKRIISTAESEAELWSVIELARQFGPNGHGMLSELERMRTKKDYAEYADYWLEIADTFVENFPNDPEAVLLYAHLTREYVSLAEAEHKTYFAEIYKKVRTRLEGVLKKMSDNRQNDNPQYFRLSVELCANYQQSMRDTGYNAVTHHEIKERVREAFRRSKQMDTSDIRKDFSSNYLLDILINAYFAYRDSTALDSEKNELAEIMCDIDDMLNLDDLVYEKKSQDLLRKVKEIYSELGDNAEQMVLLQQKLTAMNSDALLYLQARMMWQAENDNQIDLGLPMDLKLINGDYYSLVCRDIPYSQFDASEKLYSEIVSIAGRVEAFLKEHDETIRKTRSERCVAMLLRAKWLQKMRCPMLAEKQHVPMTRSEWEEVNELCNRYHSYRDSSPYEAFIPAYFLKGVYEWIYGNPANARDWFTQAKDCFRGDPQARTVERLVLCIEGTSVPRTFQISVQQRENRKYTASIIRETTQSYSGTDGVSTRYGMGVSDTVLKYLFEGTMPRDQRQQAKKEGVIRFNLIGAQIGMPGGGGHNNGQ